MEYQVDGRRATETWEKANAFERAHFLFDGWEKEPMFYDTRPICVQCLFLSVGHRGLLGGKGVGYYQKHVLPDSWCLRVRVSACIVRKVDACSNVLKREVCFSCMTKARGLVSSQ